MPARDEQVGTISHWRTARVLCESLGDSALTHPQLTSRGCLCQDPTGRARPPLSVTPRNGGVREHTPAPELRPAFVHHGHDHTAVWPPTGATPAHSAPRLSERPGAIAFIKDCAAALTACRARGEAVALYLGGEALLVEGGSLSPTAPGCSHVRRGLERRRARHRLHSGVGERPRFCAGRSRNLGDGVWVGQAVRSSCCCTIHSHRVRHLGNLTTPSHVP